MSEFGGLQKHQNSPVCTESVRVFHAEAGHCTKEEEEELTWIRRAVLLYRAGTVWRGTVVWPNTVPMPTQVVAVIYTTNGRQSATSCLAGSWWDG